MAEETRFFIPQKINVGYQTRSDTYTGKLAYVIYFDQTGKLRKEASWNSWRNEKIDNTIFNNEPLEGFVLNKHVGGCKSGWDFRQSYTRVYDPRGFEFEITIDNLLWILEWEDCLHGKGLTGKYCYGWVYDQLYLIPCSTEDYAKSKEMSDNMFAQYGMSKNDLVVGASYKIKATDEPLVYIGSFKVQNKLGKGFKTQMLFADYSEGEPLCLYGKPKSSILCRIGDTVLDKDIVDNIIERWYLSAYSYEFWKSKDIIKEFTSDPHGLMIVRRYDKYAYNFYVYNGGIISEDGKSVEIAKLYKKYTLRTDRFFYSSYRHYEETDLSYQFAKLDTNLDIVKHADIGRYNSQIGYWGPKNEEDVENLYKAEGRSEFEDLNFVDKTKLTDVYYITNNGYISDSIQALLETDCLSYVSDNNLTGFRLPRKLNEK